MCDLSSQSADVRHAVLDALGYDLLQEGSCPLGVASRRSWAMILASAAAEPRVSPHLSSLTSSRSLSQSGESMPGKDP